MNTMKKFTTFTACAAIVPVLTLGSAAFAQTQTGTGMQGKEQSTSTTGQGTMGQRGSTHNGSENGFFSNSPVGALYADDIIGKTIKHRASDEDVGSIDDLVIGDDGSIIGVLVTTGGFLGMGGQEVNLSWDELHHTMEDGEYEFYTDITEDALRNAPKYGRK
ncbi:PRC-barrel domain-containing protein [Salinispirillum sp. LH 10-3-1]|uniref:PRC-barrel domain-containing protein n=1 Tax=Salinispirillum sp. LH 10-3-1 TaxID=2952525 RepID=A0AB38YC02_9GAMM